VAQRPAVRPFVAPGNRIQNPCTGTPLLEHNSVSTPVRIGSRVVLGFALLLLVAAVSLIWFRENYDNSVYPGVHVAGVDLSGMSHGEATAAIEARATELEETRAYFEYQGQTWSPTLRELGVTVEAGSSIDSAFHIGREDDALGRLKSAVSTTRSETWLPLQIDLSSNVLESWAAGVDRDLGIVPKDATLIIENGVASINPEINGTIVDRLGLQQLLVQTISTLQAPNAVLPVMPQIPTVYADDFAIGKSRIDQALSDSVTIRLDGQTWTISPADFGQFISTEINPSKSGPDAIEIAIDERGLSNFLNEELGDEVSRDPVDAKVAWNGERVIAIEESQPGAMLRPATLASNVAESFFGDHQPTDVPITVVEPKVDSDNLDALGITTKLAAASSNFDGSDDARATNIVVGTNLLNGELVPPGGEFSFHHAVGIISVDNGFVEADVIDGEQIGRDVGGGICQVSTTVFRAALYSGLPISEWWPHRFRLGFYELDGWTAGLDASILQPEGDPFSGGNFKFVNPTDSWLLVESYVEWPRAYVVIYGPDLGYDVKISEPIFGSEYPPSEDSETVDPKLAPGTMVQADWAQKGLDVSYNRVVYGPDGEVAREDTFKTHFSPRGNVYKVSPDMQGRSPAARA
jgi:vancomycin resistance protein YoaR